MTTQVEAKQISVENVLFATDFSKYSNEALPFALSIARKYGAKILALHVISPPPLGISPLLSRCRPSPRKRSEKLRRE